MSALGYLFFPLILVVTAVVGENGFLLTLGLLMFFVPLIAGIIMAVVSARGAEKRREAEELRRLQKDEEARRLEAERRAEEKRRLEEAARLQEERTKREREERERRQAEEIRRGNEEEAMRLKMPLFTFLSSRVIPPPLLSPLSNWIRETWQHEANDFTPWLAEHLELVSDCTGLELHHLGKEVAAAGGRADIVAWENKSKSKVVIENQIESANARHFQQLISYGETLQARIRIWIAAHFGRKYRRLVTEQNRKEQSKPDAAIYYLLRIDRSVDDGQPFLSLELGPTQTQLERILLSQDEQNTANMLVDAFWSRYGQHRRTHYRLDNHENVYVSKSIDINEARIRVGVWCPKGYRRQQRQRLINNYANRLLADFPEANTQKDWGYDEINRTLLDFRLSINLENLTSWDEIEKWFSHIREESSERTLDRKKHRV